MLGTPQAVISFLESDGFEHVIRLVVSLGGDTGTLGAMPGNIAQVYYGILKSLSVCCYGMLKPDLRECKL